jgi:hypothetical protein
MTKIIKSNKKSKSKSNNNNMKGTPPLMGRALTNDLCSQNLKVKNKVKTNDNAVLASPR